MKMKNKLFFVLGLIMMLPTFSSCSTPTKNTIGLMYYIDKQNLTCTIGARTGFNMEEIYIPNTYTYDGVTYKIVGLNSNQKGDYKGINIDFLEGNKFIKKFVMENEYITYLPWDIFRDSSLKYADFSKCSALKAFSDHVFTNSALEEIKLPPNFTQTYSGVFSGTKLKSVTFPDTYVDMYIDTFFNCKDLEYVNLGHSITYISGSCFERTPSLKKVICPAVTRIDQHALRETPKLENMDLSNVTSIGYMSFYKSNIQNVTLKDVYLETDCFRESNLISISIENCDEIPYKAFGDCKNLENVTLKGDIYKIGSNAFRNTKISKIELPYTVKFIGSEAFYNCKNLNEIKFSSHLEAISTNAFKKCSSLTNIELPSSLLRLYDGAFIDTKIKEVNLSKSVSMLGECFPKKCKINYIEN